jgi:hypothetical protein
VYRSGCIAGRYPDPKRIGYFDAVSQEWRLLGGETGVIGWVRAGSGGTYLADRGELPPPVGRPAGRAIGGSLCGLAEVFEDALKGTHIGDENGDPHRRGQKRREDLHRRRAKQAHRWAWLP